VAGASSENRTQRRAQRNSAATASLQYRMLCDLCKEPESKVRLTHISGDQMWKVELCVQCANEKGVNDPTGFSLADLLLEMAPESRERKGRRRRRK
jgi:hypothetical protein